MTLGMHLSHSMSRWQVGDTAGMSQEGQLCPGSVPWGPQPCALPSASQRWGCGCIPQGLVGAPLQICWAGTMHPILVPSSSSCPFALGGQAVASMQPHGDKDAGDSK